MITQRRQVSICLLGAIVSMIGSSVAYGETRALSLSEFRHLVKKGLPAQGVIDAQVLAAEAEVESAKTLAPIDITFDRQAVFTAGDQVVLQNLLSAGWSVDISGARGLRVDAAEANVRATKLRGQRGKQMPALQATETYYAAARARLRLRTLLTSRQPLLTLVESVRARAQAKDATAADKARFELALVDHDTAIAAARVEVAAAERKLALVLGKPGRIGASDTLAAPAVVAAAKIAVNRPDIRALAFDEKNGDAAIAAAGRWWVPTIGISAGYLNTDFGPGSGPGADVAHGYAAIVTLSVPIFSRGEAERKRGAARVALAKTRHQLLQRQATAHLQTATARLQARVVALRDHERKRLPLVETLVKVTESAYAESEATALELEDAYQRRSRAHLQLIELRYQLRLAELAVRKASGARD